MELSTYKPDADLDVAERGSGLDMRTRTDVGYVFETINPKVYPMVGLPTRAVWRRNIIGVFP